MALQDPMGPMSPMPPTYPIDELARHCSTALAMAFLSWRALPLR